MLQRKLKITHVEEIYKFLTEKTKHLCSLSEYTFLKRIIIMRKKKLKPLKDFRKKQNVERIKNTIILLARIQ